MSFFVVHRKTVLSGDEVQEVQKEAIVFAQGVFDSNGQQDVLHLDVHNIPLVIKGDEITIFTLSTEGEPLHVYVDGRIFNCENPNLMLSDIEPTQFSLSLPVYVDQQIKRLLWCITDDGGVLSLEWHQRILWSPD